MLLIKNAELYAPEYQGKRDILISNDKIIEVGNNLNYEFPDLQIVDAQGKKVVPGFIDQHVHITGGGGENGFSSKVPELKLSDCIKAGVTTVVGMLGTDSRTRSVENLVAKAKALKEEGLSAYCLTGAYEYPSPSITGSVAKDILFVEEVIGVKLAISDHRCSNPTKEEIIKLASEVRIASLVAKKPGVVHMHVGAGKNGLEKILEIVEETDIPIKHFRPTHIRQNKGAMQFAKEGGYLDFTSGSGADQTAKYIMAYKEEADFEKLTLSSDANGSMPVWNMQKELIGITASKMDTLFETVKTLINQQHLEFDKALMLITSNVAKGLNLYPTKGAIQKGSDADLVLLDEQNEIDTVWAKGCLMMKDKEVLVKGCFEE